MTPRPRKKSNQGLPENLYRVKVGQWVGYRYRHPVTHKFHGMGTDKQKAIKAAMRLNSILAPQNDLVSDVLGVVTVAAHVTWFFSDIVPGREYADNTITMYRSKCNKLLERYGERSVESITVKDISDLMDTLTPRAAQQMRQVATDVFRTAAGRGLIETNPAEQTNKPVHKKARKRLTLEQFNAIHEAAPTWLQNAMQLALITLQRRADISNLRFSDVKNGCLYVIQQKTEKYDTGYLKITTGPELKKIIANCRADIPSPYLIHRKPDKKIKRKSCDHWTQITPDMITRQFQETRDNLEIFNGIPAKARPGFHEIKALGIKQYKDSGAEPQHLAGHSAEKMTKNYDLGHDEIRWIETKTR